MAAAVIGEAAPSPGATGVRRPSWNPLRVGGTSLPPHLLLIAKLIVLTFLVKRVEPLSDVYLPFLRIFDQLNPMGFYRVSQVVFAAAALLVNRWVRAASFTLGSLILLALLASRPFNRDATLFCGAILLLIGLYVPRYGIWLLRLQIIVVYFGAAYNKFLEPDWPSGQFFQHWMTNTYGKAWYGWITSHFPPLLVSKVMSRMVMAMESFLTLGFSIPRLYPAAIWVGMLLHTGMLVFVNETFKVFFYGILASYLVFVRWPSSPVRVIYDDDCSFCTRARDFLARFDLEDRFQWIPLQAVTPGEEMPRQPELRQALHLLADGTVYRGFRAFKMLLLYNPLTYFLLLMILALPQPHWFYYRKWLALLLLLLFSRLFEPIGEAAYALVARNRQWFSSKCALPAEK
jgi:predicted DCC family thiol-disulfide oxidoreductase YuxK